MAGRTTDWDEGAFALRAAMDRGAAGTPGVPVFEGRRHRIRLAAGEQLVGALPATNVRYRVPMGTHDVRWGPLTMRLTLTTHRIVLSAVGGAERAAAWPDPPNEAPLVFHTSEPPGALRGSEPVRVAGQVPWERVSRVDGESSRILILMPISHGFASLTLHVPNQLGRRVVAAARAAFVHAGRETSVDTPFRVDAEPPCPPA